LIFGISFYLPKMETACISCYDYTYYDNNDNLTILMWGLNPDSDICCLRVENFTPFCYIELPTFVNGKLMKWGTDSVFKFKEHLNRILKDDKPIAYQFEMKPKLYYYRGDTKFPMLLVKFKTLEAMKHCVNVLKKPTFVSGIGKVFANVWEDKLSPVLKMLTRRNVGFAQWIKIKGDRVEPEEMISSAKHEFVVKFQDIEPMDTNDTKDFNTHPMVLSFDFETYSHRPKMFPEPYFVQDAIFIVSCIYQQIGLPETRRRVAIVYGYCDPEKVENADEVIVVDTEGELMTKFKDLIVQVDPVIITGYNILGFDYRYMDARVGLGIDDVDSWGELGKLVGKISDIKKIQWQSGAYGIVTLNILDMPGRVSIDLLPLVKRDYKLDKYDLETVSQHFLGVGKHEVKAEQMFEVFKLFLDSRDGDDETAKAKAGESMTDIVRYCVQDSDLVINLFEKLNIWVSLIELSNVVSVPIIDLFTRGQQIRCQSQIYRLASSLDKGFVITGRDANSINYAGGSVHEPVPGLYENVICLDFASLYPSIMRAYNICFTTLVPKEYEADVPDKDCHIIEFDQEEKIVREVKTDGEGEAEIEYDDPDYDKSFDDEEDEDGRKKKKADNVRIVHHRYKFIKKEIRKGLLPELVENLVNERNSVRKFLDGDEDNGISKEKNPVIRNILNSRQLALKVSANSFYGFLGVQKGKLPLLEGAMSITAKGRELIKQVGDWMKDTYDGHIVYGDTDSCMVEIPAIKSSTDCYEWGMKLSREVSATFPPPLKMEFEKAMRLLCFKKKKYMAALINKKGEHNLDPAKILKKGIVLARRDNCKYLRKVFSKVADVIMRKGNIEDAFDIIVDSIDDLISGRVNPKELSIIKTLGDNYKSPTYFMKVFGEHLKSQGKMIEPGERLEFVYIQDPSEPLLGKRMKLIEDYNPTVDKLDYIYYLEHLLGNPLDQLFSVGYNQTLKGFDNKGLQMKRKLIPLKFPYQLITTHLKINSETLNLQSYKQWFRSFNVNAGPPRRPKFTIDD